MNQTDIIESLKGYISKEILDGEDIGLEPSTPLIEWGVINSMEIARLIGFIHERFGVGVPSDKITLDHFKSLDTISLLVMEQRGS